MKKLNSFLVIGLLVIAGSVFAGGEIISSIDEGSTGTTSATVMVKEADGVASITDLSTQVDSGNVSATVDIRIPKAKMAVTSATLVSTSVIYFDNSASLAAKGGYALVKDGSGSYQLCRITAAATTSITCQDVLTSALSTSDFVYPLKTAIRRPANYSVTSGTIGGGLCNIYLPSGLPSALTLDGNTTSCKITVSGVRSNFK